VSHLAENLLVFGRLLRAAGLEIHMGRMLDLLKALQYIDLASRDEVYHTCRTLLVHRREDLQLFDRTFELFWSRRDAQPTRSRLDDRRDSDAPAATSAAIGVQRNTPEPLGDTVIIARSSMPPSGVHVPWSSPRSPRSSA